MRSTVGLWLLSAIIEFVVPKVFCQTFPLQLSNEPVPVNQKPFVYASPTGKVWVAYVTSTSKLVAGYYLNGSWTQTASFTPRRTIRLEYPVRATVDENERVWFFYSDSTFGLSGTSCTGHIGYFENNQWNQIDSIEIRGAGAPVPYFVATYDIIKNYEAGVWYMIDQIVYSSGVAHQMIGKYAVSSQIRETRVVSVDTDIFGYTGTVSSAIDRVLTAFTHTYIQQGNSTHTYTWTRFARSSNLNVTTLDSAYHRGPGPGGGADGDMVLTMGVGGDGRNPLIITKRYLENLSYRAYLIDSSVRRVWTNLNLDADYAGELAVSNFSRPISLAWFANDTLRVKVLMDTTWGHTCSYPDNFTNGLGRMPSIAVGADSNSWITYTAIRENERHVFLTHVHPDFSPDTSVVASDPYNLARVKVTYPAESQQGVRTQFTAMWNGVPFATQYRVQVALDSTFQGSGLQRDAISSSPSLSISGLFPDTEYFLRVSASSPQSVGPWSTVIHFKTIALSSIQILSPTESQQDVLPAFRAYWSSFPGATYWMQIAVDSSFQTSALVVDTLTSSSDIMVRNLHFETEYFIRVAGKLGQELGPWSTVVHFRTLSRSSAQVQISYPGQNQQDLPVEFYANWSWLFYMSYRLQLATDSSFQALSLLVDTVCSVAYSNVKGLSFDREYYIRVASTSGQEQGPWSSVVRFRTISLSSARVQISYPSNNQQNVPIQFTATWNSIAGVTNYRVHLATDSSFQVSALVTNTTSTTSSILLGVLSFETEYFMRVSALSEQQQGPWSTTIRFRTAQLVPAQVTYPNNSQQNVPVQFIARWTSLAGASDYRVQVAKNVFFEGTGLLFDITSINASFPISGLKFNSGYFIRVSARISGYQGPWSNIVQFTTLPAAVTIVTPAAGVKEVPTNIIISWHAVPEVRTYRVQLAYDSIFSSSGMVVDDPAVTDTIKILQRMRLATHYYLRVAAISLDDEHWSEVIDFTTAPYEQLSNNLRCVSHDSIASAFFDQNFPNPFNGVTRLRFGNSITGKVKVEIFGLSGVRVAELCDQVLDPGSYELTWTPGSVASGVYICTMVSPTSAKSRKLLLIR